MNNLEIAGTLATAPSTAFAELRERPRFLFPLLLVALSSAAIIFWYFSVVDIDWYKETVFGAAPKFQEMDADKRAAAMSMMTASTLRWGSTVSVLLFVPVMFVFQALCLWLAAKVTKLTQGFKHWFTLVCWSSLPALLGTIVAAILLFLSDSPQVSPGTLQQLSLNELVFHVPPGPGYGLISSLSIPAFLGWGLMIIGVRTWTQRSWVFSATFILSLVAIIYGVWAIFSFR